jgi:hypothetical protein
MAGLTNIFGGSDDGSSSNASDGNASGSIVGDVGSTLGLDIDSSQSSYNADEDGNVSQNTNDNSIGLDTSTDGLLGSVGDLMGTNSSQQTSE